MPLGATDSKPKAVGVDRLLDYRQDLGTGPKAKARRLLADGAICDQGAEQNDLSIRQLDRIVWSREPPRNRDAGPGSDPSQLRPSGTGQNRMVRSRLQLAAEARRQAVDRLSSIGLDGRCLRTSHPKIGPKRRD